MRIRLRELAGSHGYRRLTVLLKREGWEAASEGGLLEVMREDAQGYASSFPGGFAATTPAFFLSLSR